jgi:outer membrane protein assembly factor BamB
VSDSVQQIISTPTLSVLRMNRSVAAITGNGSIAWTLASAATDVIADADGTVYLVENGVRAIDVSGVERWHNATPLAGCVLATSDKLVVCRNNSVITALDRSNGQVRWSTTAPASYGNAAAISGDRILLSGAFIFALDARTGAVLGRTLDPVGEYDLSVGNGVMAAASFSSALLFRTPFSPGSEWAQSAGNAGRGNRVSP